MVALIIVAGMLVALDFLYSIGKLFVEWGVWLSVCMICGIILVGVGMIVIYNITGDHASYYIHWDMSFN